MAEPTRKSARLQLLFIAAIFFGPLLLAAWMYYGGHFVRPSNGSNHGALLEPIINLNDQLPDSGLLSRSDGLWLLTYLNADGCAEPCRTALYTMRQSRLMLGKDKDRLIRGFLHGDTQPDKVFLTDEHQGLIATQDATLSRLLNNKKPAELEDGGYFLIDPLGNLVMYFQPDIDPSDMVDDIKRVLRLSRIG